MEQNKKALAADLTCVLVAIIWGSGFIASQYAINANMDASLIMAGRFLVAAVVMLVISLRLLRNIRKADVIHGTISGVFLFMAFYTQIQGQARTMVSHSAFLTATNVMMVPFLVWIITKKRPKIKTFVLSAVMLLGIGVLTLGGQSGGAGLQIGDILTLLCALFFALHIAYLGFAVKEADPRIINLIQISTAAVISVVVLLFAGKGVWAQVNWASGSWAVLYLGVFSTCLCYFLQTTAQKYTTASKAGIFLSTEGLFGTAFSVVLGLEPVTANMVIGGLIVFTSVVLTEVKWKRRQN